MSITSIGKTKAAIVQEGPMHFTPAKAMHVYNACRYERNRGISKQHVSLLREQMQRGTWLAKSPLDFARKPDGSLTLVNGHHRLAAQSESNVDIEWQIIVHDVADDDDLASLFWRFDTTMRKRSINNVLSAVGAADTLGLTSWNVSKYASAVRYIGSGMASGNNQRGMLADDILRLMAEWQAEALIFQDCLALAPKVVAAKMRSAQIFAVALITIRANQTKAISFWSGIAADDGLRRGDPRKTLLDYMRDMHLASGGYTSSAVAAARAWNAYTAGKQLSMIRVGSAPVRIDGADVMVQA